MFKSKKLGVDSAFIRPRAVAAGGGAGNGGKVRITAMPGASGRRAVPESYRTLEHAPTHRKAALFFFVLLVAAGIYGYYWWTTAQPKITGDSVLFDVSAPAAVVSGDEVTYQLTYQNIDRVALSTVELDVQWPAGFYFNTSSVPPVSEQARLPAPGAQATGGQATTWQLGPLDQGETKTISITGQLVGLKDSSEKSVFRLSYRPANISSDFEIEKEVAIIISDAKFNVQLSSADKVLAGQMGVPFTATIDNLTDATLEGIDIEVIAPKDFEVVGSEPKMTEGHWRGVLGAEPLTIKLAANVAADAEGEQGWVVMVYETIGGTGDDAISLRRLLRQELRVSAVKPDFSIELKVNGESTDFDADYGDTLNYQAKIINRSSPAISDVTISALIDSDVIDRKSVQSDGLSSNKGIAWTKEHVEALGLMQPGAEVLLSWKAQLLPPGTAGRASVDTVITVEIEGLEDWHQNSPVFIISVGEGLVFNQGLYWDLGGATVGSGNLPPVTNERTVYLAVWSLDSGSQDYDSVTVSTFLPDKVEFFSEEEVDEGSLSYDAETRRLEWQINNFSTKLLPLKATFYVKLVPLDEDVGKVMTVLNPASVVASGTETFEVRSFANTSAQVITKQEGDVGTVKE